MRLRSRVAPNWPVTIEVLLLVVLANGLPVLARLALHARLDAPLDGGRLLGDGRPWLGPSKTWRGLLASVLVTPLAAVVLGLPWGIGLVIALGAMLGDLAVSFAKRRLDISPSSPVFALDEIPESLLPALLVKAPLGLTSTDVVWIVAGFLVVDQVLSPLAIRWRARRDSS